MNVLVINLPNATERNNFQKGQLTRLNLGYEFINAVSISDINTSTYKKHYFDWQRPLRKAEVACYFSHRAAWQIIIDNNKPALILEDDALLSKNVPKLLKIFESYTEIDMINLEVRGRKKFISRSFFIIDKLTKLYKLYQDRTGAAGYVLWPSGATKLLNCEQNKGIALADAHITNCHSLLSYQVEPAPIVQLDQCNKYNIQVKTSLNTSISSISNNLKYDAGLFFKTKRIRSQIKLGLRQLFLLIISTRRYIEIDLNDFDERP